MKKTRVDYREKKGGERNIYISPNSGNFICIRSDGGRGKKKKKGRCGLLLPERKRGPVFVEEGKGVIPQRAVWKVGCEGNPNRSMRGEKKTVKTPKKKKKGITPRRKKDTMGKKGSRNWREEELRKEKKGKKKRRTSVNPNILKEGERRP